MEPEPERQRFHTFFTIMRLIYVILPGLGAYTSAVFLVFYLVQCGILFNRTVHVLAPGSGVPSGIARLYSSPTFFKTLVLAIITQICSTTFVVCVATLYRADALFRRCATPILAGLRTASGLFFFFFFKPVANLASNIAFLRLFLLLDAPGEFDLPLLLPAAAAYLVLSVRIAAACHKVPALQAARGSGFDAMCRRLVLFAAAMFYALAAIFALLDALVLAVMTAFPPQSRILAGGMAMIAVLCMLVAVTLMAQPVIYLLGFKNYRP